MTHAPVLYHREWFHCPQKLCTLTLHASLLPALETIGLFTVSIVLPFPECHVVGFISHGIFSGRLLSNVLLSFLHIFSWPDISLLFSTE